MEGGIASGKVIRHEEYPERVGREILKDLAPSESGKGVWRGQIYAVPLGEYMDVEASLPEPDSLDMKVKIGFMSRTVSWVRVATLPSE